MVLQLINTKCIQQVLLQASNTHKSMILFECIQNWYLLFSYQYKWLIDYANNFLSSRPLEKREESYSSKKHIKNPQKITKIINVIFYILIIRHISYYSYIIFACSQYFSPFLKVVYFLSTPVFQLLSTYFISLLDVFIDNIHIRHESIPFYQKRRIYKLY